ncbi:hypothetical protein V3C99_013386 [Haemonchus contortus]|uniref:Uncharacterized protein n=1 Tax=Haemonchus contortus TaxID=6289 RepID=A0A7I4Z630_HAECO
MVCAYYPPILLGQYLFIKIVPRDAFECRTLRAKAFEKLKYRQDHRYLSCFWSGISLLIEEVIK